MSSTVTPDVAWEGVLSKVRTFPTLPMIVHKITEMVNIPETSAKDIEVVIAKDQVLTGKLLRLVNSPFYGFPQKVTTISRAVGIIGFEALRNLIFSSSVINLFRAQGSELFRPAEFWKHSVGTALAAKELARHLGEKQVEEFFVGGLMHDIGKLVHEEYFCEPFRQACSLALSNDILLLQAEQEVLHFTHDQTGGLLLKHWNLPLKVVAMVRFHHQPAEAAECQREAGVIHLADILCRAKGLGSGGDNKIPLLDQATWNSLGLTLGDLEQVMGRIAENFDEAVAFLEP
ncbi:MAG TPA: HDOD domain-containing protein [Nitrospirales bacterium]|jgi:putative nucleotidyltransferase with HDIG domain